MHWLNNLETALYFHEITILYGNIQDYFPIPEKKLLMSLREIIELTVKQQNLEMTVIDLITSSSKNLFGGQDLTDTSNPTCFLIFNMQIVFYKVREEWQKSDWERYHDLLILIKKLDNKHRLILIFPEEGQIPPIFLNNVPNVKRLAVSMPDILERSTYFHHTLQDCFQDEYDELDEKALWHFIIATEGLYWRELVLLEKICQAKKAEDPLTIVRRFKFGSAKDYWGQLLKERANQFENAIQFFTDIENTNAILGQNEAVEKTLGVVAKACLNLSAITTPGYAKPRGILFFVGPTGIGKTMLAKKLAQLIFESDEKINVFDMSEYSQEHSEARLVGAPPGYIGYEAGGQLTGQVREDPFSVLLFDEIDKAHPSILNKFLQILDEGRLTDGKGQLTYFSEALIIFTSNCGAKELDTEIKQSSDYVKLQKYYINALEQSKGLRAHPEIINRIGVTNIIPFRHITNVDFVKKQFNDLCQKTIDHFSNLENATIIQFINQSELIEWLSSQADWRTYGMRNVKQTFEAAILEKIAAYKISHINNHQLTIKYINNNIEIIGVN